MVDHVGVTLKAGWSKSSRVGGPQPLARLWDALAREPPQGCTHFYLSPFLPEIPTAQGHMVQGPERTVPLGQFPGSQAQEGGSSAQGTYLEAVERGELVEQT